MGENYLVIKAVTEHDAFIKLISNPDCHALLHNSTKFVRYILNKDLPKLIKAKASREVRYVNWMLRMSEEKFYLKFYNHDAVSLFDIDLNSTIVIRYCNTITDATKKIFKGNYEKAIEIVGLHSNKKGEGKRLIKESIDFSSEVNLPLVLYTETDELVKYYEQFSFVNHGKLGINNEYLMVRLPT